MRRILGGNLVVTVGLIKYLIGNCVNKTFYFILFNSNSPKFDKANSENSDSLVLLQ